VKKKAAILFSTQKDEIAKKNKILFLIQGYSYELLPVYIIHLKPLANLTKIGSLNF
jgi:hypothetical protein